MPGAKWLPQVATSILIIFDILREIETECFISKLWGFLQFFAYLAFAENGYFLFNFILSEGDGNHFFLKGCTIWHTWRTRSQYHPFKLWKTIQNLTQQSIFLEFQDTKSLTLEEVAEYATELLMPYLTKVFRIACGSVWSSSRTFDMPFCIIFVAKTIWSTTTASFLQWPHRDLFRLYKLFRYFFTIRHSWIDLH